MLGGVRAWVADKGGGKGVGEKGITLCRTRILDGCLSSVTLILTDLRKKLAEVKEKGG